ncbi:LytR/AlgR family response regulator transcription factor [Hymenobacter properus]|uniref:Response regulator transcription factor n=1 Tax=Hymenobacter properus TaxID=2791026 RepID=A0A931BKY7_9BACT|nr:response regulator transcription factor [Hymenobacter properus]MBF9143257.1 response regulator transcription factor [Hymenobacter properus]MBR7722067.1 response regulator transcription factor [Microvirga sp. SRT04]
MSSSLLFADIDQQPALAAVRVLVVEDEPLYADQVESMLLGMGYETVGPAASAQVAMALYRTEPIDLVLLDIGLRGPTNGLQLAEQLLAHSPVPLIFLTSFSDEQTFQLAQAVGPAAYLTKPAVADTLHRAITLAVKNFASSTWPAPDASPQPGPAQAAADSVFVKENGLLEKVHLRDIFSIVADNKTCSLTLAERSIPVRMSMRELARILPAERFVQIQRSYFVNVEHIERLDPTRLLVQVGKQVLPVGRLYLPELISRLRTIG